MATELETGLPSVRYVQNLIKDAKEVELQLLTGEKLSGKVLWQDQYAICFGDPSAQILIRLLAIAYIRPKS
jgi:host factor-I protein